MTEETREQAAELFEALGLTGGGLAEAWLAFENSELGTMRVAGQSLDGHSPSGLFLHRIRKGDHLKAERKGRKWTGWRFVRGTHAGSYVRDPKGTDPLPKGYGQ